MQKFENSFSVISRKYRSVCSVFVSLFVNNIYILLFDYDNYNLFVSQFRYKGTCIDIYELIKLKVCIFYYIKPPRLWDTCASLKSHPNFKPTSKRVYFASFLSKSPDSLPVYFKLIDGLELWVC